MTAAARAAIRHGLHFVLALIAAFLPAPARADAGLGHLKGCEELLYLGLAGTQVTDAGLARLKGLNRLRALDLTGTQVTKTGAADLKKALPGVWVVL